MASCRSCLAMTRWVKLDTGKPVMLNPEPVEDGNVYELPDGTWHVMTGSENPPDRPLYVVHFRTCPQANQWRRKDADRRTAPPGEDQCTKCHRHLDPAATVNPLNPGRPHTTHPSCDRDFRPRPPSQRLQVLATYPLDATPFGSPRRKG